MESADLENFEDLLVSADTLSWDKWLFLPADEPWHLGSPATTLKFEEVPPEEEGLPDAGIPKFAKEHGLRETLEVAAVQGIVSNAREQKPTATAQDLFIAFKYYWQNDAFIVFA